MITFRELARNYGATTWGNGRGLEVVSVPAPSQKRIDLSFCRRQFVFLGKIIPAFRRYKISDGIFVYGTYAKTLHVLLAEDKELFLALELLLGRYAYAIEWSENTVSARINLYLSTPDGDETGGEKFLSNLDKTAKRLMEIIKQETILMHRPDGGWGPARARNLSILIGIVITVIIAFVANKFIFKR